MSAMSAVGIDFGNESCFVAIANVGGVRTFIYDFNERDTPSYVAFGPRNRVIGVAAKNQMVTNMTDTIHGFKRLLGRSIDDPYVKQEIKHLPFNVVVCDNNKIGINVNYQNEKHTFSVEQITGMFLTKLKEILETSLKTKVNNCVISVPSYFTNAERKALLDSASIAGLNVLQLFNETTATALDYGIHKYNMPISHKKLHNVVIVDCGHTSLQVFACTFNMGKLKMLASAFDSQLGGRAFDFILAEHFSKDFQSNYNIDPKNNANAFIRLLAEVEKIKKQMSTISTTLTLKIEKFMEGKDVHSDIKRTEFEELAMHLFNRVENTLKQCMKDSKLSKDDIDAVISVGGSSRIPYIKGLIKKNVGKTPVNTFFQDEAVARGCALQCAILSSERSKDFSVTDIQSFPIELQWEPSDNSDDGRFEVFPKYHPVPFSKMLSFYRPAPFTVKAHYSGSIPYPDSKIGQFTVDVKPTADRSSQKVEVEASIDLHGIFSIRSATLLGKSELQDEPVPPSEPMESSVKQPKTTKSEEKKKSMTKTIDLHIESITHGFSTIDLNNYIELEGKMEAFDRQDKERVDACNSLIEYICDMRLRIANEEDLASYIVDSDRENISKHLDDLEICLHDNMEDFPLNTCTVIMDKLKKIGESVRRRKVQHTTFVYVKDQAVQIITKAEEDIDAFYKGSEQFNHLDSAEVDKLRVTLDNAKDWLVETVSKVSICPVYYDIPINISEFAKEKHSIETNVCKVLYKPKPASEVEPPPYREEEKKETEQPVENGKDA